MTAALIEVKAFRNWSAVLMENFGILGRGIQIYDVFLKIEAKINDLK